MSKREAKKREIRYEVKVYVGEGQGRTTLVYRIAI